MKQRILTAACIVLLTAGAGVFGAAQAAESGDDGFADNSAKRSYALGMNIARSVAKLPVDFDIDALAQGLRDVLSGTETRLSDRESKVAYQALMRNIQVAQTMNMKEKADANLKASKAFLAENKTRKGVKVTASGLQYKVLKKGSGPQPDLNDTVTVHYVGKLIDGTVFDSSRQRGKPATFPVNGVIAGWTEALQMMHEGARYKLFIPAKLAYGMRGAGRRIGPNETLIFTVELLGVHEKE